MSNLTLAKDAQKFLNSMQAAVKFAQAVADYELTEAHINGAKAELDTVKNEVLAAKDELAKVKAEYDATTTMIQRAHLDAEKIMGAAVAAASTEVKTANYQAEQIVMQAENEAKAIVAAAVAEKSKRTGEIDTLNGLIEDGKKELAKVEKALADLKKKFG